MMLYSASKISRASSTESLSRAVSVTMAAWVRAIDLAVPPEWTVRVDEVDLAAYLFLEVPSAGTGKPSVTNPAN